MARGARNPELKEGLVDTSGCVSLRPSHLQVISLGAMKKWKLRSLDIKNAFLQADTFKRDVFLLSPPEWCPNNPNRAWKLNDPANGLNDAPVAFRRTLKRYLLNDGASTRIVGLKYRAPSLGPRCYAVFNNHDEAAGAFSTHIDDVAGCGAAGVLERTRHFSE